MNPPIQRGPPGGHPEVSLLRQTVAPRLRTIAQISLSQSDFPAEGLLTPTFVWADTEGTLTLSRELKRHGSKEACGE